MAHSMEIGVKVRMGILQNRATGRTRRTVKSMQYAYVDDPDSKGKRKRVLTGMSETVTPTSDRDSTQAIQVINRMTGLDAMQAGVRELAIKEAKSKLKVKSKKPKKVKKQSKILDRKYVAGEVSFPIYVFNSKLIRTVKIKSIDELQFMGLHLGTILTCVRDKKIYSKHYFSYNKSM